MSKAQYALVLNHINGREEFDVTKEKINKPKHSR